MIFLLDTTICVYLMKGVYPNLSQKVLHVEPDTLAISSVTYYELLYGAKKAGWGDRRREQFNVFLSAFQIIPFDDIDASFAADIRADLVQKGLPIGPYDIQIAAQGLARNWTVVTHNTKEFSRVHGLKIEDWVE